MLGDDRPSPSKLVKLDPLGPLPRFGCRNVGCACAAVPLLRDSSAATGEITTYGGGMRVAPWARTSTVPRLSGPFTGSGATSETTPV